MTDILNRARAAALVALAEHGQTTDIQELLVAGNPSRSMPPGALDVMVRAVIRAMREPTQEMTAEGCDTFNMEVSYRSKDDELLYPCHLLPVWQSMIDAALT